MMFNCNFRTINSLTLTHTLTLQCPRKFLSLNSRSLDMHKKFPAIPDNRGHNSLEHPAPQFNVDQSETETTLKRGRGSSLAQTVSRFVAGIVAYDSHHPQSVKRGIVECLFDRAKHLTSKPSAISEEKKHLLSVLVSSGYPSSFVRKLTKTTRPTANKEPTQEFKSTAALPYIKGVSEVLRRCLQQQGVRTILKSDTTPRFHAHSATERRP